MLKAGLSTGEMPSAGGGPWLLPERRILLSARALGERLAEIGRAGEEFSASTDSDDSSIPPLSGRKLRWCSLY
jgi:hypothetical protein